MLNILVYLASLNLYLKLCPNWCFTSNIAHCETSRIIVGWLPAVFNVNIVSCTSQMVHVTASMVGTPVQFACTFVSRFNDAKGIEHLWTDLQSVAKGIASPWLVLV